MDEHRETTAALFDAGHFTARLTMLSPDENVLVEDREVYEAVERLRGRLIADAKAVRDEWLSERQRLQALNGGEYSKLLLITEYESGLRLRWRQKPYHKHKGTKDIRGATKGVRVNLVPVLRVARPWEHELTTRTEQRCARIRLRWRTASAIRAQLVGNPVREAVALEQNAVARECLRRFEAVED